MQSKLLKRAKETKNPKYVDVAAKHNAIKVLDSEVTLNDDVVHLVMVVSDKGNIPGIMIKDLNAEADHGVIIERNFIPQFIENVRDAFIQVRIMEQELKSE